VSSLVVRLRNILSSVVAARESVDDRYFTEETLAAIEADLAIVIDQVEAGLADPELLGEVVGRLEALADENESLRRELDSVLCQLRQLQAESGGDAS